MSYDSASDDGYVTAGRDQLEAAKAKVEAARALPWWRRWLTVADAEDELRQVRQRVLSGL